MKLTKGSKVIYLPTGEKGIVTKEVAEDLFYIRINGSSDTFPAVIEDLSEDILILKEETTPIDQNEKFEESHRLEMKEGLYLCAKYKLGSTDNETKIPVYLWNNYQVSVQYDINFYSDTIDPQPYKGLLFKGEEAPLLTFVAGELEDNITFEIDYHFKNNPDRIFQLDLTLKAKNFFKVYTRFPFSNDHGFVSFLRPSVKSTESLDTSLSIYTKANQKTVSKTSHKESLHPIVKKAAFNPVLDLHAEKLIKNFNKMTKGEILNTQLQFFERFLDQAMNLGVKQLVLIHGIGNGKLKDEIATRLIMNPNVNTFKNEFHPKYGYGATEIILY